jgi:hypothetical protein
MAALDSLADGVFSHPFLAVHAEELSFRDFLPWFGGWRVHWCGLRCIVFGLHSVFVVSGEGARARRSAEIP